MRWIVPSLLLIAVVVWAFSELPASSEATAADGNPWRRTEQGWEHIGAWTIPVVHTETPPLHPAVVALGQVLVSVFALLALDRRVRTSSTQARDNHAPHRRKPRTQASLPSPCELHRR